MQKQTKTLPLVFKDEKEVEAFEERVRQAHTQYVPEEPPQEPPPDASWIKRKAPGIAKRTFGKLFPPRKHHQKAK
jgi:hypothetical protein